MPELDEESAVLSNQDVRALVLALPLRHRWRRWNLLYSTARDGISLQTLYRSAPADISHKPAVTLSRHDFAAVLLSLLHPCASCTGSYHVCLKR